MKHHYVCAVLIAAILVLCTLAGTNREAPLVGNEKFGPDVASLEDRVAQHPDDLGALSDLCQAYLDRRAPGLALAAIQHASESVRQSARITHLSAMALLHEGRASEALMNERQAISRCGQGSCGAWLLASALRHEEFLAELVRSGVEDWKRDPDATVAAYEHLRRGTVSMVAPDLTGSAAR